MARTIVVAPAAFVFLFFLFLSPALFPPAVTPAVAAGEDEPQVTGVGVVTDPMGVIATIEGNRDLQYEYVLMEGSNLVVDIFDAVNAAWPSVRSVDSPFVRSVKIAEHLQPRQMVRVIFEVGKAAPYDVKSSGSKIIVSFGRPGERPPPPKVEAPTLPMLKSLIFHPLTDKSRVEIAMDSPTEYLVERGDDPAQILLRLKKAQVYGGSESSLDISDLERELRTVVARAEIKAGSPTVLVTAQLAAPVPYRVTREGNSLFLDVDRLPAGAIRGPGRPSPEAPSAPKVIHYGKKISLDFVDAEISDVLRLISDVSNVNFAMGSEVKGRVSVRLVDVPWETALDTILMTNNPPLVQVPLTENIIRITTEDTILNEEERRQRKIEMERRNLQAQRELEEERPPPMMTREFSISYARLGEGEGRLLTGEGTILGILESFKSKWNELFVADPRTNTVIVRDARENVEAMERVLRQLDTPTPAVIVEARIVEVGDDVTESLGIRWNMNAKADPAHGNALPFAFPNSMHIQGAAAGGEGQGDFMVNLPASTPTAAIGLSFGHIASTLTLDMQLSALEEIGTTKILSNPRILVVQNEKASINIGDKLPIPRTDVEGNRTVEFERTGILLEVTPQVTNDGHVFMDLRIEKSQRGETVATTDGPMYSINSRDALTRVLVGDGETAVIGGILTEELADNRGGVPYLSKVPGLGWLFRNKTIDERRTELMIFLTPRIVAMR